MGNNYSLSCIACNIESIARFSEVFDNSLHTCAKGSNTSAGRGTASAYTFDNYQEDTGTTAIYPDAGTGSYKAIDYLIFGLVGEVGSIPNAWKKLYRDLEGLDINSEEYDSRIFELKRYILRQIGDALWYASRLTEEFGVTLGDVAAENIRKLSARRESGTLRGSGDNR